jgi:CHAD domain-containing protein
MSAQRVPQVAIASQTGLSERQVRRWQRAFQRRRMAIFEPAPGRASRTARKPRGAAVESTPQPAAPVPRPGIDAPRKALTLADRPGTLPDDPMSEAGRKILAFQFERMLLHEPGSRLGQDIEAEHDMRVAIRRLRSAFCIFEPYYRRKVLRPLLRDLRKTARCLGRVRDLDVFIFRTEAYQAALPEKTGLEPLLEFCRADREAARADLIAHLDSPTFARFVEAFDRFVSTPNHGARSIPPGAPVAFQVRHIVPRLIYTAYENVRAYETAFDQADVLTLHALRIEGKRLRYALEFFEEVLGGELKGVIQMTKRLQDHLGDLNDTEVAGRYLREFMERFEQSQAALPFGERANVEPVVQYLAYQYAEKHRLLTTFPDTWAAFNAPEIRRGLALAVAAL